MHFGFVYCRSTPTNPEIKAMCKFFDGCDILMGDFNLSHRCKEDQEKVIKLCQGNKINALKEVTRAISNNQLEYILLDESLKESSFVTSYNNFISDHKTIVSRIGLKGNFLTNAVKERIAFDQESHLKTKISFETPDLDQASSSSGRYKETMDHNNVHQTVRKVHQKALFARKFENPDMTTCWLNSCLQLTLTAIDYDEHTATRVLTSELGKDLLRLHACSGKSSLDPSLIKDIIVTTEDTRIAMKISDVSYNLIHPDQHDIQERQIRNLRLDLRNGQQCVRDYFLCLNENLVTWPDVYSMFSFSLTHSTECTTCKSKTESETHQLYLQLPVPESDSSLKESVEELLNERSKVYYFCDDCKTLVEKIKQTLITKSDEANFLTVILTRGIETIDGFRLVENEIKSTDTLMIRYIELQI